MKRVRFGILRRVLSNGPRSLSSDLAVFSVAVVVALKVFGGGGGRAASVSRLGVREDVISLLRGSCARFFASFGKVTKLLCTEGKSPILRKISPEFSRKHTRNFKRNLKPHNQLFQTLKLSLCSSTAISFFRPIEERVFAPRSALQNITS